MNIDDKEDLKQARALLVSASAQARGAAALIAAVIERADGYEHRLMSARDDAKSASRDATDAADNVNYLVSE